MKISSFSIQGLHNEFSYEMELCQPLTFIHAPNGTGKSTMIRMLYAALRGDMDFLERTQFERLDIGFDEGSAMIIEKFNDDILVQMQKSEIETPITPDEMSQICQASLIPADRLVLKRGDGHLAPALEIYAQDLLETIRYAKEHKELTPCPSEKAENLADGDLEFWCKDLKAKLDFIKDAGFEPAIPAGMKFPPSRYEIGKDKTGYAKLATSIEEYVERNYLLAESIIIFKDIVNEIFINKGITVSDSGKLVISTNSGAALHLNELSSGEKQILVIFYSLLFHVPQGSIVLMDEPENSLHVTWQQRLGDFFMDICRVRDIQMIISTHSPQVIHNRWTHARELRGADE